MWQKSWFCWAQGQLHPVRDYLCLYWLKSSEDTFISGLKGWFQRNKQRLGNMVLCLTAIQSWETRERRSLGQICLLSGAIKEIKTKAIVKSVGWTERAFTWYARAPGEISTFQAQTHDPTSSTAMGLAQRPPSLRQINKPPALRLILSVFRSGLLKHLPASEPSAGLVRSEEEPENLHFYQVPRWCSWSGSHALKTTHLDDSLLGSNTWHYRHPTIGLLAGCSITECLLSPLLPLQGVPATKWYVKRWLPLPEPSGRDCN